MGNGEGMGAQVMLPLVLVPVSPPSWGRGKAVVPLASKMLVRTDTVDRIVLLLAVFCYRTLRFAGG